MFIELLCEALKDLTAVTVVADTIVFAVDVPPAKFSLQILGQFVSSRPFGNVFV